MFRRLIQPLSSQSFFLFGARGTGKSTFLRQFFAEPDQAVATRDQFRPPLTTNSREGLLPGPQNLAGGAETPS